jgi:HAD superfamily hydrolase (TIGR01549 family)
MPRRAYTTILFDLDNTLCYYPLSTEQAIAEAMERANVSEELVGSAKWASTQYDSHWVEAERSAPSLLETRRRLWRHILTEGGRTDSDLADRLAEAHHQVRQESGVKLYPGVGDLLADLGRCYRLGLLTNGSTEMQWDKIRLLGIERAFDAIIVAGDVGIYKPDPEIFRILLSRLEADPGTALFVGDSYDMDIVGAHGAGLDAAWIRTDGTPISGEVVPGLAFVSAADLREALL